MEWNFGIKKLLLRAFKVLPKHSTLQFLRQFTDEIFDVAKKENERKKKKEGENDRNNKLSRIKEKKRKILHN